MANENVIPQLRFPEFSGNWKPNLLGEIAIFSKGKGISKSEIDKDGEIECIRYGELYTEYSETISEVKSRTNVSREELVFSEANDVIIPASGETQIDIATASCILRDGIALGGDLNIIKSKTNGVFLSYYLNNGKKKDIAQLAQGISVVHLYASQLKQLKLILPKPEEQNKIASFIAKVNNQIQLLEKEKTLLEQYKKGISQKIFNQEIRFKDDSGNDFPDWEEKILRDICHKKSSNISANTLENNSGIYKVYGANGLFQTVNFFEENEEYISIVKDGAGIGRIMLCEAKSSVLGTMDIIKPNENGDIGFLFSVLLNINFKKYGIGSTIPHIYFKDYCKEKINIPSKPEQQKISGFISSIESYIQKTESQIFKSKDFKKGLFQKMFV